MAFTAPPASSLGLPLPRAQDFSPTQPVLNSTLPAEDSEEDACCSRLGRASGPALHKLLPTPAHWASTTHCDTFTSCKNGEGSAEAETAIPRRNCGGGGEAGVTRADSTAAAPDEWNGNLEPWAPRDALRYLKSPWRPLLATSDSSSLCGETQVWPALRTPRPPPTHPV